MSISGKSSFKKSKIQGVGIGLRSCHYQSIIQHKPRIPWFEVISDNYMIEGGPELNYLESIRNDYPIVMHGVGMSVGSVDDLNMDYLGKLRSLKERFEPAWISDHLCWVSADKRYFHDLLPLPYTQESIDHVAKRVQRVQNVLGERILLENVSNYMTYKANEMTEWEFLSNVAEAADCNILLDINNVYVSSYNHKFDPFLYLNEIPVNRVKQFHLAGYQDKGLYLFDSHSEKVKPPVWDLYEFAVTKFGSIPTLIEWDDDIPSLSDLLTEANKASKIIWK